MPVTTPLVPESEYLLCSVDIQLSECWSSHGRRPHGWPVLRQTSLMFHCRDRCRESLRSVSRYLPNLLCTEKYPGRHITHRQYLLYIYYRYLYRIKLPPSGHYYGHISSGWDHHHRDRTTAGSISTSLLHADTRNRDRRSYLLSSPLLYLRLAGWLAGFLPAI